MNKPQMSLEKGRVRIRLAPRHPGRRRGLAFDEPTWGELSGDETAEEIAAFEAASEIPLWHWMDSVRIAYAGTVYEVIPVNHEGRPALVYYSELAPLGVITNDDRPLPRQYLAHIALTFLESGTRMAFGVEAPNVRPDRRRPEDETLLRVIRRALSDGTPARQVLSAAFQVELTTADDWIRYARKLPGAELPAPKGNRGRTRKAQPKEGNER
jgi:hypothetical protein